MTRLTKNLAFRWLILMSLVVSCPAPLGAQSKMLTWLRERAGERKAMDAQRATADAAWRREWFADQDVQDRFIAAIRKSRCNMCHVRGEKKEVCNAFGDALSDLLLERLKMDSQQLADALKTGVSEELGREVEAAFFECLDKTLQQRVEPDREDSETYGDRVRRGESPIAPIAAVSDDEADTE